MAMLKPATNHAGTGESDVATMYLQHRKHCGRMMIAGAAGHSPQRDGGKHEAGGQLLKRVLGLRGAAQTGHPGRPLCRRGALNGSQGGHLVSAGVGVACRHNDGGDA
jgi:hypothetical protein